MITQELFKSKLESSESKDFDFIRKMIAVAENTDANILIGYTISGVDITFNIEGVEYQYLMLNRLLIFVHRFNIKTYKFIKSYGADQRFRNQIESIYSKLS